MSSAKELTAPPLVAPALAAAPWLPVVLRSQPIAYAVVPPTVMCCSLISRVGGVPSPALVAGHGSVAKRLLLFALLAFTLHAPWWLAPWLLALTAIVTAVAASRLRRWRRRRVGRGRTLRIALLWSSLFSLFWPLIPLVVVAFALARFRPLRPFTLISRRGSSTFRLDTTRVVVFPA